MYQFVDIGGLQYLVCSTGRVVKRRGMGFLKTWPDKDGYHKVSITTKDGTINEFLHRLVWRTFNGPIPDGMTVDHIDDDKNNNWLDNLQLLTATENVVKGNAKHWIVVSPEGEEISVYNLNEFCRNNNLNPSHMAEVARGYKNRTQHKGWKCYERR